MCCRYLFCGHITYFSTRKCLLLLRATFQNTLIQETKWLPIALNQKAVWKVTQKNRCYCSAKSPPVWGLVCSHLWGGGSSVWGKCVRVQGWLSGSDGLSQMKSYLYLLFFLNIRMLWTEWWPECKIDVFAERVQEMKLTSVCRELKT